MQRHMHSLMNILRQMSSNHWQPWSWLQSAVCLSQQNDLPAAATTEGRDNSVGSRPTEKPGLSPRCGSRQLSVQNLLQALCNPTCAIAFINIRAHVKNLKHWQPCHCLDTRKYYTHWQEWVVLLLQLLCLTQVRWPEFPTRDKEVLKKKKKKICRKTTTI